MKSAALLLAATSLTACVASSGGSGSDLTLTGMNPVDLEGFGFTAPFASIDLEATFAFRDSLNFSFDANGSLTLSDGSNQISLSYDETLGAYVDDDDLIRIYAFEDPSKPGVFVFKVLPGAAASGGAVAYIASGDLTPGGDLPTSGSAAYSGGMEVTDNLLNTAGGAITFVVDFSEELVSGEFTIEDGTVYGDLTLEFTDAAITKDADSASFNGELSLDGVVGQDTGINGIFMGDSGEYVGGTIYVNDDISADDTALVGVFTAGQ